MVNKGRFIPQRLFPRLPAMWCSWILTVVYAECLMAMSCEQLAVWISQANSPALRAIDQIPKPNSPNIGAKYASLWAGFLLPVDYQWVTTRGVPRRGPRAWGSAGYDYFLIKWILLLTLEGDSVRIYLWHRKKEWIVGRNWNPTQNPIGKLGKVFSECPMSITIQNWQNNNGRR